MSLEDLRARFGLPRGASSAALERVLRQMRDGDDDGGIERDDDDDGARATRASAPTTRATVERASKPRSRARSNDARAEALRRECETLRRENRALRHARVRATVVATTSTSRAERPPAEAPAALAKAWNALETSAAKDADVGTLMKSYKEARRERAKAHERIAELEARLATAREETRALEVRERQNAKMRGVAEAIIDEEADERLALRKRLTETLGERAALKVECETQRETIESMRANERRLRDDVLKLEKRLVRAASTREMYRKAARALEASERESAERGERLALVEAECVMLAEMVREMNKLSGVDPREFMAVAERALLGADVAPRVEPPPERSPSPAASDDGYVTPDEDDASALVHDALARADDDDFPSPPISAIVQSGTPGSAGSTAFNF